MRRVPGGHFDAMTRRDAARVLTFVDLDRNGTIEVGELRAYATEFRESRDVDHASDNEFKFVGAWTETSAASNPLEALARELVVAPPLAAVVVPGAPADPADVVLRARVRDGAVVSCVSEPRPRRLSLAPGRCLEWPDPLREAKRLLLR